MCVIRVFVINVKLAEQSEPRPFVGPVMASEMILSEIGLRMSPGPEIKYYSFAWSNQQFWAHYKNLNRLFIMNWFSFIFFFIFTKKSVENENIILELNNEQIENYFQV